MGSPKKNQRLPITLWRRCGKVKALSRILQTAKWRDLAPDKAAQYLEIFAIWDEEISNQALQAKWRGIAELVPALDSLLATVPAAYQGKVISLFRDWFYGWDDPKRLKKQMTAGLVLAQRVQRTLVSAQFTR